MKKNRHFVKLISLVGAFVIVFTAIFAGCSKKISLKDFKSDGEYKYDGIAWNSSLDTVTKAIPFTIEKDMGKIPESGKEYFTYVSKDTVSIGSQKMKAEFEFDEDKLKFVSFYVNLTEDEAEKFFDEQLKLMKETYGDETEKSENPQPGSESTSYSWEESGTVLGIMMVKSNTTLVKISLGVLDK